VTPDDTEYSFIVIDCLFGGKSYYDTCLTSAIYSSLYFTEAKHIFIVRDELEGSWELAFIDYV